MINPNIGIACGHCNEPIDPFAAFCSSCGAPGPANPTRQPATSPPVAQRSPAAYYHHQRPDSHGWLLLVAGVAVVTGFFLPWITAQIPLAGKVTVNGTDVEAWILLSGGSIVVLLALQILASGPGRSSYAWPLALLVALGSAGLTAASYQAVIYHLGALDNQGIRGNYGIGLWLIAAGLILAILASVGGWGATHRTTRN